MKANKSQEDEFYKDLDEKSAKKSFCSWPLMVAFFVIVLVLALLVVFYFFKTFKNKGSMANLKSGSQAVYALVLEKFKIDPVSQPTFEIALSSQEIESLLTEASVAGVKVKNIQVAIDPLGMTISGAMAEKLKSSVKINALPQAKNGKIIMEVTKITVGTLTVPQILYPVTEGSLNSLLDKNFANFYQNYEVEKIELSNDQMTVFGRLKNK